MTKRSVSEPISSDLIDPLDQVKVSERIFKPNFSKGSKAFNHDDWLKISSLARYLQEHEGFQEKLPGKTSRNRTLWQQWRWSKPFHQKAVASKGSFIKRQWHREGRAESVSWIEHAGHCWRISAQD